MHKIWAITGMALLIATKMAAQDPVFSQPFLSPIYLNPAATGTGDNDLRISAIYRRQYLTIPSNFNYEAVSVERNVASIKGGFGFLATRSSEGYLKKTGIYGSYSYAICSGTPNDYRYGDESKWFITVGIQGGMAQRRIDYSQLVFADQINTEGYIPGSVTAANPAINSSKWFPDFATGLFFKLNFDEFNHLLIGASGHHINRPDESLTATSDTFRSQLPIRWGGNILYTHTSPDKVWSYRLAAIGYQQSKNNSVQVGFEATQNDYDISLGLWYRSRVNLGESDAISLTLTINLFGGDKSSGRLRAGLAYDAPVGNNRFSYTTGSAELGVVWDHGKDDASDNNMCRTRADCPPVGR